MKATVYSQQQNRKLRNLDVPVQFPAPTAASFFPINVMRLVINSETEQDVRTYGFDLQNTFLLSPRNLLTAGFTLYRDRSHDDRTSSAQMNLVGSVVLGARGPQAVVLPRLQPLGPATVTKPVRVPDASLRDLAFFAQDEWDVTPRLRAVAGVRVDGYAVRTKATPGYDVDSVISGARPAIDPATLPDSKGDAISRSALTGDLGFVFKLSERLSAFARYGRSYRHPNLEELLFSGPATIGSIAPNVKVGPEKGDNLDFGFKLHTQRLRGSLTYFNNTYKGFISTQIVALLPGGSVSQAVNFAKVRIQGLEGDFESSFTAGPAMTTLFGRGSYNKGDVLLGQNPLTGTRLDATPQDNVTPFKLIAGARLSDRRNRLWAEYSFRQQSQVDRVASTRLESPFLIAQDLFGLQGFTLHRVGLGYDWDKGGTNLGISVSVENLANRYYREQFQFAPARGRLARAGTGFRAGVRVVPVRPRLLWVRAAQLVLRQGADRGLAAVPLVARHRIPAGRCTHRPAEPVAADRRRGGGPGPWARARAGRRRWHRARFRVRHPRRRGLHERPLPDRAVRDGRRPARLHGCTVDRAAPRGSGVDGGVASPARPHQPEAAASAGPGRIRHRAHGDADRPQRRVRRARVLRPIDLAVVGARQPADSHALVGDARVRGRTARRQGERAG